MKTKPKLLCLLAVSSLNFLASSTPAAAQLNTSHPYLSLGPVNSDLRSRYRFKLKITNHRDVYVQWNVPYTVTATYSYYRATYPNWVTRSVTDTYSFQASIVGYGQAEFVEKAPQLSREVETDMNKQGYILHAYTIKLQQSARVNVESPWQFTYIYPNPAFP